MEDEEFAIPDTANSSLELAYGLQHDESYPEALEACDAAIERARCLLADAYNLRGIVLEELDRPDDAEEAYRTALEIDPSFQEAADNLRDLEADLGLPDEPVTIANFGSVAEAYLAHGQLEAEGVWSFVADEYAALPIGPAAGGGSRLMVRAADVATAMDILGIEIEEDEFDDDLEEELDVEEYDEEEYGEEYEEEDEEEEEDEDEDEGPF
jgi:tetratricopeptide (TPR) repeat protein